MTYKITLRGELVIDKYAPFSPEETKRIFEDLKQLINFNVDGHRMSMPPDNTISFGCFKTTPAEINRFYQEYESGSWKQTKLGPWHVKETFVPGDTFKSKYGDKTTICQVQPAVYQLISFSSANRWSDKTIATFKTFLSAEQVAELLKTLSSDVEEFAYIGAAT